MRSRVSSVATCRSNGGDRRRPAGDRVYRARRAGVRTEVSNQLPDLSHRVSEAERVRRGVPSARLPHAGRDRGDGETAARQPRRAGLQEAVAASGLAGRDLERRAAGRQRQAGGRQHVVAQRRRDGHQRQERLPVPAGSEHLRRRHARRARVVLRRGDLRREPRRHVAGRARARAHGIRLAVRPRRSLPLPDREVRAQRRRRLPGDVDLDRTRASTRCSTTTRSASTAAPGSPPTQARWRFHCRPSFAASKATASSSTGRCGSPASPTASGRAPPDTTGASTATTRRTSTRGSTTRSAAWASTATPAASRFRTRTGATTRCVSACSPIAATAATSTSR